MSESNSTEERLDALLSAERDDALEPEDRVSLVTFDDTAQTRVSHVSGDFLNLFCRPSGRSPETGNTAHLGCTTART